MAAIDDIRTFAQSVYLRVKNRYFDDIEGSDGDVFVNQIIDFTNGFIDELENEQDASGIPVNWDWVYEPGFELGTATEGDASISFPSDDVNNLIAGEERYVQILQDGVVISNWAVVQPGQISSKADRVTQDMCARVGDTLTFSRAFKDTEDNGTIIGDVTLPLPRLTLTNADILTTVKPQELLVLGVAKNNTLPDIVRGGLSPSYVQKFNDLLTGALARNTVSSISDTAQRDDLSGVGGVY